MGKSLSLSELSFLVCTVGTTSLSCEELRDGTYKALGIVPSTDSVFHKREPRPGDCSKEAWKVLLLSGADDGSFPSERSLLLASPSWGANLSVTPQSMLCL